MISRLLFLFFLLITTKAERPEQIHLSFGVNVSQMVVTWVTMQESSGQSVHFGIKELTDREMARSTRFVDGGEEKRVIFIHRAIMTSLKPSMKYKYRVGSESAWSPLYVFRTLPEGSDWTPSLAIYGDLGTENAQSVPRMTQDVLKGAYDAILHVGDFAYDMDSDNARVGDAFMRVIEPMAARVAYQTTPGNHEHRYNFSNYENRFSMIDQKSGFQNNHFYAFNLGPAHFVSFSTEFYYYLEFGWDQIRAQYEWLERDLAEANREENRLLRPWIITLAHKPLYCMTFDFLCREIDEISFQRKRLRKGIRMHGMGEPKYGLEDLLHKYKVDIQLYGHEHNYQRMFPVFDNHVFNGSQSDPYDNPKASVVIVTGSAGCKEDIAPFRKEIPEWSAFRNSDYGFSRMTFNKTHLRIEQISDDQKGKIVDQFVVTKDYPRDTFEQMYHGDSNGDSDQFHDLNEEEKRANAYTL